jgi:hypothetical protein
MRCAIRQRGDEPTAVDEHVAGHDGKARVIVRDEVSRTEVERQHANTEDDDKSELPTSAHSETIEHAAIA